MNQPVDLTSTQVVNLGGPLLVGYLLSWGLYGALSVQVYIYYLAFPKDRLAHKLLVYGVFIIETLDAVLVAHDVFASFVDGFGDFQELSDTRMTWLTMPILSGIVAFCVQIFYAFRIITLSKSRVVGFIISLMAVVLLTGAIISGIEETRATSLLELTSEFEHISDGLFNITSGACDIVIAIYMTSYLSRKDDGFLESTHAIVSRIIRLVVGTSALTAAVAIINISLYYFGAGKYKEWFLASDVILGRLYPNSMMVIFNSRLNIVGGRGKLPSFMIDIEPSETISTLDFSRQPDQNSVPTSRSTLDTRSILPISKQWSQQVASVPLPLVVK